MGQSELPNEPDNRGTALQHAALVLLLVAAMVGWFVASFRQGPCASNEQRAKLDLSQLYAAIQIYAFDMESIPSNKQGLTALVKPPIGSRHAERWKGPYPSQDEGLPMADPWGRAYRYQVDRIDEESRQVTIRSLGPDGRANTKDDVTRRFTTKMTIDDEGKPRYAFVSDGHQC